MKSSFFKKTTIFALEAALMLSMCACDSMVLWEKAGNILNDCVEEYVNYEYSVRFKLANSSDKDIVDSRIKSLSFSIEEVVSNGDDYVYRLRSHYYAKDEYFGIIGQNQDVQFIDRDGEVVLTRKDIISVVCWPIPCINVYVTPDFAKKYNDDNSVKSKYFVKDDVSVQVFEYAEDEAGTFRIRFSPDFIMKNGNAMTDEERVMICGAVMLSSPNLSGNVEVEVLQSATYIPS